MGSLLDGQPSSMGSRLDGDGLDGRNVGCLAKPWARSGVESPSFAKCLTHKEAAETPLFSVLGRASTHCARHLAALGSHLRRQHSKGTDAWEGERDKGSFRRHGLCLSSSRQRHSVLFQVLVFPSTFTAEKGLHKG